jgi:hypothetical protein
VGIFRITAQRICVHSEAERWRPTFALVRIRKLNLLESSMPNDYLDVPGIEPMPVEYLAKPTIGGFQNVSS